MLDSGVLKKDHFGSSWRALLCSASEGRILDRARLVLQQRALLQREERGLEVRGHERAPGAEVRWPLAGAKRAWAATTGIALRRRGSHVLASPATRSD